MIPFNKPYYSGSELDAISKAMETKMLTGDTFFLRACESFLEKKYGFHKVFLTTSCTTALEMAALLAGIEEGDEVIMPSYTYVSTANAFALRGAKIIFADSNKDHPQMDEALVEGLISERTKAIVVVHYGGMACNMDFYKRIAGEHQLLIIEDAAQCIDSFYNGRALGSIGSIGCFSFHETKNIHSGEGGFIAINDQSLAERAAVIRNKGTNRSAFIKGEVNKYQWVDLGFSAIPSALNAAFLLSQLAHIDDVQKKRKSIWEYYFSQMQDLTSSGIQLPVITKGSSNNAHIFYLVCRSENERTDMVAHLKENGIQAVFHYQSLHNSPFFSDKHGEGDLVQAVRYSNCLLRLPLFYDLTEDEITHICRSVKSFFDK